MPFDYKKEYKEFYLPPNKPTIVKMTKVNYLAVRGEGNPNLEDGDYQKSIGLLYSIAFTLKMSYKNHYNIEGYFAYVVPPLEGFWWQEGIFGVDLTKKESFNFISVIRLPDFITKENYDWAITEATLKKKQDFSKVEFFTVEEGTCVQCMHIGPYDSEPETVKKMGDYAKEQGYKADFSEERLHHEIYLSDPRKVDPEKLKTVIRHPIKKTL